MQDQRFAEPLRIYSLAAQDPWLSAPCSCWALRLQASSRTRTFLWRALHTFRAIYGYHRNARCVLPKHRWMIPDAQIRQLKDVLPSNVQHLCVHDTKLDDRKQPGKKTHSRSRLAGEALAVGRHRSRALLDSAGFSVPDAGLWGYHRAGSHCSWNRSSVSRCGSGVDHTLDAAGFLCGRPE